MLKIKIFNSSDLRFILKLHNQSVKEKIFYQNDIVKFDDHKKWINFNIKNKNISIHIFYNYKKKIGYSRFNKLKKNVFSISIALDKKYRNKGFGKKLLKLSIAKFFLSNKGKIFSFIKTKNLKSINIFKNNFFKKISKKKFFYYTNKKIKSNDFSYFIYKK